MRALPFKPRPLLGTDFDGYTKSWEKLIAEGSLADLEACFMSSDGKTRINYVYLDESVLGPLLKNAVAGADFVKTKFVLVPGETPDDAPVFSLALYHTTADGCYVPDAKNPAYYLAGVAALPAELGIGRHQPAATPAGPVPPVPVPPGYVPTATAEMWIKNWNDLHPGGLNRQLFEASNEAANAPDAGTHLRGYTFMATDFMIPWPAQPTASDALWLNFDAKPQHPDIPNSALVFSTIVDINKIPVSDEPGLLILSRQAVDDAFYDISKPCPPYTC